jgi:tRNA(fMet)-specific endonuclease VapC
MSPAGSGVLLDTSVVIDHFRGDPRIGQALESAPALYMPTVVLGELYYGAFRSVYREKQLEQVRRFLRAAVVIGTDTQTSEAYGRIRSELAEVGRQFPKTTSGLLRLLCSTDCRWRPGISILAELPALRSCPGELPPACGSGAGFQIQADAQIHRDARHRKRKERPLLH